MVTPQGELPLLGYTLMEDNGILRVAYYASCTNKYAACHTHTMWELLHKKDQLSTAWVTKRLQLAACFREGSISGYCGTNGGSFLLQSPIVQPSSKLAAYIKTYRNSWSAITFLKTGSVPTDHIFSQETSSTHPPCGQLPPAMKAARASRGWTESPVVTCATRGSVQHVKYTHELQALWWLAKVTVALKIYLSTWLQKVDQFHRGTRVMLNKNPKNLLKDMYKNAVCIKLIMMVMLKLSCKIWSGLSLLRFPQNKLQGVHRTH